MCNLYNILSECFTLMILDASHSDPVTIRQSDDTTAAFSMITPNRTANPATTPSASRVHTTQHQDNTMRTAPHNASTNTSPTLSVLHAGKIAWLDTENLSHRENKGCSWGYEVGNVCQFNKL